MNVTKTNKNNNNTNNNNNNKNSQPHSKQSRDLERYQGHYTRYMNQGKEKAAHGDKVEAERNFQYAEHYLHMMEDLRARMPELNKAETASGTTVKESYPEIKEAKVEEAPIEPTTTKSAKTSVKKKSTATTQKVQRPRKKKTETIADTSQPG